MNKILEILDNNPIRSSFFIGLFFTLAFQPFNLIPFAIIFLYLVRRIDKSSSYKEAFLVGFAFYTGHYATLAPWVMNVSKHIGPVLYLGYVALVLVVALYYGVGALITKKVGLKYLPFVFIFIEFTRQFGELKFPWGYSGYIFGFNNYFIQSADIFGIFGLSLIFYIFVLLIYYGLKYKNKLFYNVAAILFIANYVYGFVTYEKSESKLNKMTVGVLQSNITQERKWDKDFRDSTYIIYSSLAQKVATDSTDLIVWPETSSPSYLQVMKYDRNRVLEIVKKTNTYNFVGGLRLEEDKTKKRGYRFYNSMFLFDGLGNNVDTYDKSVLVPFGEYLPFTTYFPFLNNIDFGQSDFSSGERENLIKVKDALISTFICFEILSPIYTRHQVAKGSNLIVTTSNDAWFDFMEPQQHFEFARFRAVENRRYLVRSGSIGISAIVTESGKILNSIDVKERGAFLEKVKLFGHRTIYNKYGDWIVYFAIFVLLVRFSVLGKKYLSNRKTKNEPIENFENNPEKSFD